MRAAVGPTMSEPAPASEGAASPSASGAVRTSLAARPPSVVDAAARAFTAGRTVARSRAALLRHEAGRAVSNAFLSTALAVLGGALLALAWMVWLAAAVLAIDAISLPLRLAAVGAVHGAIGVALLVWRARRASHG